MTRAGIIAGWLLILVTQAFGTDSKFIKRSTPPADTVIVFVHGITGDAIGTWSSAKAYWPQLVADDPAFGTADVYVYEYPSRFFNVGLSVDEMSEDMRIRFDADGVSSHRNLVFLAHSMGGLIVRSYLLKNRGIAGHTKLLYLLATPSLGSELASWAALASDNPQLANMKRLQSNDFLSNLNRRWLAANMPFPTRCAYEKRPIAKRVVVDEASASHLCSGPLDPIDADHIEIAKPEDRGAAQYQSFLNAFRDSRSANSSEGVVGVQYIRLFGALEVPLLMELIPSPRFASSELGRDYKSVLKTHVKNKDVQTQLAEFIQQWPFKNARPLLTTMWTDLAGKENAAASVAWRASLGNRDERSCFFLEPLIDGGSLANADELSGLLPKNWRRECESIQNRFDRRIGFTFLLLENTGRDALDNVSLKVHDSYQYNRVVKEFNSAVPARRFRRSLEKMPRSDALQNLISTFGTAAQAEQKVADIPLRELTIAKMRPGEQYLLLMNIYFADEHQLPAGYLYGIYTVDEVTYQIGSNLTSMKVRGPLLERAARVAVPYGWFNQ
ncbi:esterase/lipase family protein [Bradyrhizobium sp. ORS 86]|uniref:esterase/lipase family protein n=1 Tax=Bradyrhizobium sp. ORS 86 TaxID=1685970 RepID=UPI00388D441A